MADFASDHCHLNVFDIPPGHLNTRGAISHAAISRRHRRVQLYAHVDFESTGSRGLHGDHCPSWGARSAARKSAQMLYEAPPTPLRATLNVNIFQELVRSLDGDRIRLVDSPESTHLHALKVLRFERSNVAELRMIAAHPPGPHRAQLVDSDVVE